MKILHFADIHARDNDLEECEKCLNHIYVKAQDARPNLIVCSGDIFDSQNVKLDSKAAKMIFEMFSMLADVAPVVTVIGTPSHDGTAAEVLAHIKANHQVWVSCLPEQLHLTTTGQILPAAGRASVVQDEIAAIITMIPTPTKQYFNSSLDIKGTDSAIADAMGIMFAEFGAQASDFKDVPHVLVGHFQVGGAFVSETQQLTGMDIEINRDQIGFAQADLVMLGHIHLHQLINPNIFYSGSIYRKDWGELDPKGFYLHTVGKDGLSGSQFIETPSRKLVKIVHDFTKDETITWGAIALKAKGIVEGAHVRLELKVYQDMAHLVDKEEFESIMEESESVDIRIIRIPRETVRSAKIIKLATLRAKLQEMAEIRSETVPDSILLKADFLENMTADQLISRAIAGGAA